MMKTILLPIASIIILSAGLFAAPANLEPITELKELHTETAVFTNVSRIKPLVLKSLEDATKYFDKEALANLAKSVDFEKQIVLIFAWNGSGQDRLSYVVKESFPEQIVFSYEPGMTRDLRPHVKVFVLQSNVKWTVK